MRKQEKKNLYTFTLWVAVLFRKRLGLLPGFISLPSPCKEHNCSTAALHSTTFFFQVTKLFLQFEHKEGKNKNGREPREMHLLVLITP